jgi:hypothetical protein
VTVTDADSAQTCLSSVAVGQCTIAFAAAGVHHLTATYGGSPNYNSSVSAVENHTVGTVCKLCVLDPSAASALELSGTAQVTVQGGGVVVNSTNSQAALVSGSGKLTAAFIGGLRPRPVFEVGRRHLQRSRRTGRRRSTRSVDCRSARRRQHLRPTTRRT